MLQFILKMQGGGTDKRDSYQKRLLSLKSQIFQFPHSKSRHPLIFYEQKSQSRHLFASLSIPGSNNKKPNTIDKHKNSLFEVEHEESVKIGNEINLFSSVHFSPLSEVIDTDLR
jgi:hypothetical protein